MKRVIILIVSLFLITIATNAQYIFVGPVMHWNLKTDNRRHINFGLEASYWTNSAFGFDIGFEISKKKLAVYTEGTIGYIGGISGGICGEFTSDEKPKIGLQGSVWCTILAGGDLRFRYIDHKHYFSPGVGLKIPVYLNPKPDFGFGGPSVNIMPM